MSSAALSLDSDRRGPLFCFVLLQILDLITTLAIFRHGGYEANPIVRSFIPLLGPVSAVVTSKVLLVLLAWRFCRRNWILSFGNVLYLGVVLWNVFNLGVGTLG